MQPMYAPAVNYNTEFPQLGAVHRPHMASEHQARPLPQHLPGSWSATAGVGYGHGPPETMMASFGPHHLGRSSSAVYPYPPQYVFQRPGAPFMHPQEHLQPYTQVSCSGICNVPFETFFCCEQQIDEFFSFSLSLHTFLEPIKSFSLFCNFCSLINNQMLVMDMPGPVKGQGLCLHTASDLKS